MIRKMSITVSPVFATRFSSVAAASLFRVQPRSSLSLMPSMTSLPLKGKCQCLCHKYGRRLMSSDLKSRTKLLEKSSSTRPNKTKPDTTDPKRIRNIGIMAHIDAGKTTTTERMLFYSGLIRHMGDVDDGDTVMDYMDQERARGITITSAAITFMWRKHKVNLIDTPGHVDFTLEVERALRVLDGGVAIIDASAGVEAQTVTVWRQAQNYSIPCIVFVNKMDKKNADFSMAVQSMKDKLKIHPLLLQIPIQQEGVFVGVVDLVFMERLLWGRKSTEGGAITRHALTQDFDKELYQTAEEARSALVEALADIDEEVADFVLGDTDYDKIPVAVLVGAIRRACLQRHIVPVLCGSSLKNKGVQPLLDAVVAYLPSPNDIKPDFVKFYEDNLCALAFKIIHDKQRGALTFLRVYSGSVNSSDSLYNINRGSTEKIGRLMQLYADEHKDIIQAEAGNIVAVSGLRETVTGDILVSSVRAMNQARRLYSKSLATSSPTLSEECAEDSNEATDPILAEFRIPDPVFLCAIEPASMSQQRPLENALACLTREDPSLRVSINEETGQTILAGMGELHLEILFDRICKEYSVDAELGPVYIAYRESVRECVQGTHHLDRVLGDTRHQVTVSLSVGPREDTTNPTEKIPLYICPNEDSCLKDRPIKPWHRKAVQSGINSAASKGPVLSFPVVDLEVTLHDLVVGKRTSVPMVTACIAEAVALLLQQAQPVLMEPVMSLTVYTTEPYLGAVLKDLSQRRSHLHEVSSRSDDHMITATTPLAELLGYSSKLRTFTSGTAAFTMELSHYAAMTPEHQQQAVAKATGFLSL